MRKSESLERLSILLTGLSIGILFGGMAMKFLPIIIVGLAPIVVVFVVFLAREIGEKEERKETVELLPTGNCLHCGEPVRGHAGAPEIAIHCHSDSRMCIGQDTFAEFNSQQTDEEEANKDYAIQISHSWHEGDEQEQRDTWECLGQIESLPPICLHCGEPIRGLKGASERDDRMCAGQHTFADFE